MVTYNIGALLSIRPYIQSLESNDDRRRFNKKYVLIHIDKKKLSIHKGLVI